jgi:2-methylcitrate dehydratase PrpD
MQGPIDAILEIVREHNVQPEQIRKIEVAVLEAGWGIVCEPGEKKYHPESVVDAQFSMPFGAAVAAVCGAAGLDQFTLEHIRSERVHRMMGKVALVKDARIEQTFPREWPACVTIEVESGARHEKFVRYPKGDPENPLTWEELEAKFRSLAGAVLAAEQCDEIVRRMATLQPDALPGLCC